jgi:hypothetical protein
MHEYAFDIQLNTTARTYADTEAQAREHLSALDWEFQIDYRTDKAGGEVWLTDASMAHEAAEARKVEPYCDQVTLAPLYRAGCDGYDPVPVVTGVPGRNRPADHQHRTPETPDETRTSTVTTPQADEPVYRTGSGDYHHAFDVIKQPGWRCFEDPTGDNSTWVSPDAQLAVEFGPETDAPHIAPLWRVTYRNPDPYRPGERSFSAYFTGDTPAEAIAAFLTALTASSTRPAVASATAQEANIDD